jgi:hypothetical protein
MTWMADAVLAVLALEALGLLAFAPRVHVRRMDALSMLAPGAALVLALRFALQGSGVAPIGAALLLAMAAHVNDLLRRRRR